MIFRSLTEAACGVVPWPSLGGFGGGGWGGGDSLPAPPYTPELRETGP